jgi:hypothetical protein
MLGDSTRPMRLRALGWAWIVGPLLAWGVVLGQTAAAQPVNWTAVILGWSAGTVGPLMLLGKRRRSASSN